ncbi:hypothetical protein ACC704_34350 [Rhizobium johnstonii]|nr:hypothetical protein [Rhizobium leguminosarum]
MLALDRVFVGEGRSPKLLMVWALEFSRATYRSASEDLRRKHVAFIGLDTSKLKMSVVVADGERNGEVRFLGDRSSEPASVAGMVEKFAERRGKLHYRLRQHAELMP